MGLTLTVLGCSGTYPRHDNPCSGYLVRTETTTIWVDTGSGTLAALNRHVSLREVDAILISHEHPDHWLDLPLVFNAAKWYEHLDGIPVFGTAGVRKGMDTFFPELAPIFVWETIDASSQLEIGDIAIRFSTTDHPVETLAMRFEAGGRVIVYSSDTGPAWDLTEFGPGIDVALVEATVLDEQRDGIIPHLSAGEAGDLARKAGVDQLVLIHLSPLGHPPDYAEEAASAFGRPVELAQPDKRYPT